MQLENLSSWFPIPEDSDFSLYNLPYGIFSTNSLSPRAGIAIGNHVLDLFQLGASDLLPHLPFPYELFQYPSLNPFIKEGKEAWSILRQQIQSLMSAENEESRQEVGKALIRRSNIKLHLPVEIGDYTDFYSSIDHATNVGKMFRDPENALLPNWKHLPVGYHGRASSIFVSGTPIYRPKGQLMPANATKPIFGPSTRLDFELEVAFVIGKETSPGISISTAEAEDHIFGIVLFNDWSARDIQKWEYVPLGPFLGKSFASSVSPWIIPMEALAPFKTQGPVQQPEVLPYLQYEGEKHLDLPLEVALQPKNQAATIISRSNLKYVYWNMAQQLAHHTINGCNIRVGDMMASGTISGPEKGAFGSMLELSWAGKEPITLGGGEKRTFLEDGDTIIMRGHARKGQKRIGFGEVRGTIFSASS